jgi:hypothetical protein
MMARPSSLRILVNVRMARFATPLLQRHLLARAARRVELAGPTTPRRAREMRPCGPAPPSSSGDFRSLCHPAGGGSAPACHSESLRRDSGWSRALNLNRLGTPGVPDRACQCQTGTVTPRPSDGTGLLRTQRGIRVFSPGPSCRQTALSGCCHHLKGLHHPHHEQLPVAPR